MNDVTPPLEEFRRAYDEDDNIWWATACGHHQNLFESACEQLDDARKQLAHTRVEVAEEYVQVLKQERDQPSFAPGGYAAGLQYAIDLLEGKGI